MTHASLTLCRPSVSSLFRSFINVYLKMTRFQLPNSTDASSFLRVVIFLSTSLSIMSMCFFLPIEGTCKFNLAPPFLPFLLSRGSFFMNCVFGAPSPHEIHFWWLVLHELRFWCTISTWDPPLVARFSWAALLVPHIYTGSTSGGSFFMGCTSGAPYLHGIHFWWLVPHGMHFWCPISTRDPLLVAHSPWAALLVPHSSWAAPLMPHLYTGSTSGGSFSTGIPILSTITLVLCFRV